MEQNKKQCFDAAGKVFLLGEYAVLTGLPAVIATVGARFELQVSPAAETSFQNPFPQGSPAARLVEYARLAGAPRLQFEWRDPHTGKGGFGASTAQFALVYRAFAQAGNWDQRWQTVLKVYRELTASGVGIPPSGADLVAQWMGGVVLFAPPSVTDVGAIFDWSQMLIFSATGQEGRKVATHSHLAGFAERGPGALSELATRLNPALRLGIESIQKRDGNGLGRAMDAYAETLAASSLVIPATLDDRAALRPMPGVLGVKGSGALQADSILVLMEPSAGSDSEQRRAVIRTAESRGLTLLCNGLIPQSGVV